MKQHDIKHERTLNGNTFYVRPFGAFKASNISGELMSLLTPVLTSLAPIVAGASMDDDNVVSLFDTDVEKIAPHLTNAVSGISGDKVEALLVRLLIQHKNISVQLEGEDDAQLLTRDLADEVFCGDVQDMFILAFDVIKVNYAGFFKRLGGQYGDLLKGLLAKMPR